MGVGQSPRLLLYSSVLVKPLLLACGSILTPLWPLLLACKSIFTLLKLVPPPRGGLCICEATPAPPVKLNIEGGGGKHKYY